jgi:type IX secretion system substrate protein
MKKVLLFIFLVTLTLGMAQAATITATTSGNWGTNSNWDCNCQPGSGDSIIIPSGIIITVEFATTYDLRGAGVTTITVQAGGELNGVGISTIRLDSGDGDKVVVDAGGVINPELIFRFGTGFGGFVIVSTIPIPGASTTVPGPATIENGALPITLLFFDASTSNGIVNLTWATATEENFDYFSIERSVDGEDFKEIAQIQGVGESFERVDYEFIDEFPLAGISYYRLRSIDFDGYTEVFEYKMVDLEGLAKDFSVFPNPITDGHFSLQTNFVADNDLDLIVYNNVGKIEASFKVNDWLASYDISDLQPGSYLVKLTTPDGATVKRILIK